MVSINNFPDYYMDGQMGPSSKKTEKKQEQNPYDAFINESYIPVQSQLQASLSPKQAVDGLKLTAEAIMAITTIVQSGRSLWDVINSKYPNASDTEKAQIAKAVTSSMKLDVMA